LAARWTETLRVDEGIATGVAVAWKGTLQGQCETTSARLLAVLPDKPDSPEFPIAADRRLVICQHAGMPALLVVPCGASRRLKGSQGGRRRSRGTAGGQVPSGRGHLRIDSIFQSNEFRHLVSKSRLKCPLNSSTVKLLSRMLCASRYQGSQIFLDTYAVNGVNLDLAKEVASVLSKHSFLNRFEREAVELFVATHGGYMFGLLDMDFMSHCPDATVTGVEKLR
jgi:hypothetical protein